MGSATEADAAGARSSVPSWPALCWAGVLLLIGLVQVLRAQWFDAALFLLATTVVLAGRRVPSRSRRRVPARVLVFGAAAAGSILCLLPRHHAGMVAAVLAIGVAAVAIAWTGPVAARRPWSPALRRLAWAWACVVIAGCLWELVQFIAGLMHPDAASYALSDLIDPLLDGPAGRIGFVIVWLAGGVFLLRRGGGRR